MSSTSTLALASAIASGALPIADTPSNKVKLLQITELMRSLFDREEYKPIAHYLGLLADLMAARDAAAIHPIGSAEHRRLWALATPLYHAARNYAAKYKLDPPTELLRAAGYSV